MASAGAAAVTTSASEVSVSSHLFTVRGYGNTKGIGVGVSIESPAFDAAGHRWSVVFYPDGESQDASGQISVFVRLVSEASDDVTVLYGFSLVDPTGAAPAEEASKAPKVSTFSCGEARGVGCFMEQETFEASPYLQDNCFTIKCVIGAVKGPVGRPRGGARRRPLAGPAWTAVPSPPLSPPRCRPLVFSSLPIQTRPFSSPGQTLTPPAAASSSTRPPAAASHRRR
jgi:speckle-type POZ protein